MSTASCSEASRNSPAVRVDVRIAMTFMSVGSRARGPGGSPHPDDSGSPILGLARGPPVGENEEWCGGVVVPCGKGKG